MRNHRSFLLRLHLITLYIFLYVSILLLMVLSFNKAGLPTVWIGFSLEWYSKLWQSKEILSAARNTIIVAVLATVLATIAGTLLAVGVETRRQSSALGALLFAPMIIPDIVLANALLSFYSLRNFTLWLHSIILSHTVFTIAFVAALVRARMCSFDHSVLEASADLGASEFTTFRRVLLLDEPLSALDKNLREEMQLELKRLQNEVGITFLMVTHDQEEALVMADRIAVLHDGRLTQVGTPGDLYEHPTTRFVANFIGEMNFLCGIPCDGGVDIPGAGVLRGTADRPSDDLIAVRPERIDLLHTAPGDGRNPARCGVRHRLSRI